MSTTDPTKTRVEEAFDALWAEFRNLDDEMQKGWLRRRVERICDLQSEIARKDGALREILAEQERCQRTFDTTLDHAFDYPAAMHCCAALARAALAPRPHHREGAA